MIHGLFLDPRIWTIDFLSSPYWKPEALGVKVELHADAFRIPQTGLAQKYDFVLATEVWDPNMINTLNYFRRYSIPVFLAAREPVKTSITKDAMFKEPHFIPDTIFACGAEYEKLWKLRDDKINTRVTGFPRFDWHFANHGRKNKSEIASRYKLDPNKKWIFFADYPPYYKQYDLYQAREQTLQALERFAKRNNEYQVIVKLHPFSMKPFLKKAGKGNEVKGLLLERYTNPTEYMAVIGDERNDGLVAKSLLLNADKVVGYNSTMLFEASLLDIPCVNTSFDNAPTPDGFKEQFTTASNESELVAALNNSRTPDRDFVERFLGKFDGRSCERICEAIKDELKRLQG
jgi:hypothetical protein